MLKAVEPIRSSPADDDFAASVLAGLSKPRKTLPCRFFYDARGSELFEEITRLPEYYLTNAEVSILETFATEMLESEADDSILVEFGSGSSWKTEILIERSPHLRSYVPIDVSISALTEAKTRLAQRFPHLEIRPLLGDFMKQVIFPIDIAGHQKFGFFPGSTIGNFTPLDATKLLKLMRRAVSAGGRMIIGVDLKKDVRRLLHAYNDDQGVTAAFNINLLRRINHELDGNFELSAFRHEATYNPFEGRIEMRLVSLKDHDAIILGRRFRFFAGEDIHTESSHKYTIDEFRQLACFAGWTPRRVWTDKASLFSVHELVSVGPY